MSNTKKTRKGKIGRPKGTFKPIKVPNKLNLTTEEILEANSNVKCRTTIDKGIRRLVRKGILKLDRQHHFVTGERGRPSFCWINVKVQASVKRASEAARLKRIAAEVPAVEVTATEPATV